MYGVQKERIGRVANGGVAVQLLGEAVVLTEGPERDGFMADLRKWIKRRDETKECVFIKQRLSGG
jgi:hypothetical protein